MLNHVHTSKNVVLIMARVTKLDGKLLISEDLLVTEVKTRFYIAGIEEKLRTTTDINSDGVWFGASRNPQNISQWLYTDGSELAITSWRSGISTRNILLPLDR